jgi:hypothetical protein
MDGEVGVRRIRFAGEELKDDGIIKALSDIIEGILQVALEIALFFGHSELMKLAQGFHVRGEPTPCLEPVLDLLYLGENLACFGGIVPEIGISCQFFLFPDGFFERLGVKDAPRYR